MLPYKLPSRRTEEATFEATKLHGRQASGKNGSVTQKDGALEDTIFISTIFKPWLSDVCSEISEFSRFRIELAKQRDYFLRICGCFEIEIEHELEILARDRTRFDLGEVKPKRRELRKSVCERARRVAQSEHDGCLGCAGEDHELFGDADEARVVVVSVLDVVADRFETVELLAVGRGDGGDVAAAGIGNALCCDRGVFNAVDLDVRVLFEEFAALADRLVVGVNFADVFESRAVV